MKSKSSWKGHRKDRLKQQRARSGKRRKAVNSLWCSVGSGLDSYEDILKAVDHLATFGVPLTKATRLIGEAHQQQFPVIDHEQAMKGIIKV